MRLPYGFTEVSIPPAPGTTPPSVSVVMPAKDAETYIDEAIQSILRQTMGDLELIVSVNGSSDSTMEIACRFARKDQRVRVLKCSTGNIPRALNAAIAAARAPWIARMDADDISLPERLERQLSGLSQYPDVAALGTWGWRVGATGERVSAFHIGSTSPEEFRRAREEGPICILSSSAIFSRAIALRIGGFREEYPLAEDIDFWTRIADTHPVLVIPEELVCYRVHDKSISTLQFEKQMFNLRRTEFNMRRRRKNLPELSSEEFQALERDLPHREQLATTLRLRSQHCYRRAGGMLANRNPVGFAWLLLSAAYYPPLPIQRIREQKVVPVLLSRLRRPMLKRVAR